MGEQHNKKGDDWLDKTESYQYRVKSMASSNARLLSQVCSRRYETRNLQTSHHQDLTHEPVHQVQRVRQAPRHGHRAQEREDRHHPTLGPAVIQSFRHKTVKTIGTGEKHLVPRIHSSNHNASPGPRTHITPPCFRLKARTCLPVPISPRTPLETPR